MGRRTRVGFDGAAGVGGRSEESSVLAHRATEWTEALGCGGDMLSGGRGRVEAWGGGGGHGVVFG